MIYDAREEKVSSLEAINDESTGLKRRDSDPTTSSAGRSIAIHATARASTSNKIP